MEIITTGSRVGRYQLQEVLGQGGMSVVYRGVDTELKRTVAVKVMHGFLAEQPEARERFRREAIAVAKKPKRATSLPKLSKGNLSQLFSMGTPLIPLNWGSSSLDRSPMRWPTPIKRG